MDKDYTTLDIASGRRSLLPSDAKLHCIKQPFTLTFDKALPQPRTPLKAWKSVMGKVKECRLAASVTHLVSRV